MLNFYVGAGDMKPDPSAYIASALPPELFPQPTIILCINLDSHMLSLERFSNSSFRKLKQSQPLNKANSTLELFCLVYHTRCRSMVLEALELTSQGSLICQGKTIWLQMKFEQECDMIMVTKQFIQFTNFYLSEKFPPK